MKASPNYYRGKPAVERIVIKKGAAAAVLLQPFRRRLQMIFQDSTASLNPRKTVRRVLGESLALAGIPATDRAHATSAGVVLAESEDRSDGRPPDLPPSGHPELGSQIAQSPVSVQS
jgi:ABC-type dipeptide/oligopeptide/nickel transport system ATPase subunit